MNQVVEGKLPVQQDILSQLQDVFNLLPNLNVQELARAFAHKSNDMMAVIYLSSIIRSVVSLHSLIENKERLLAGQQKSKVRTAGACVRDDVRHADVLGT